MNFVLSLLCGVVIPLSPLAAEWKWTGKIDDVSWFSAGVTYVVGVGLASKSKPLLLLMVILAGMLSVFYGADLQADADKVQKAFTANWARWFIGFASAAYCIERFGLHLGDNRSFPE